MSEDQAKHYEAISRAIQACGIEVDEAYAFVEEANNRFGEEAGDETEGMLLFGMQALKFVALWIGAEVEEWDRMAEREREMDGYKPEEAGV